MSGCGVRGFGSLRSPDSEFSYASAINNVGQVVGGSQNADGKMEGFIWEDGRMEPLGVLGEDSSTPNDIHDRGEVVGSSRPADASRPYVNHPFLWSEGRMHDLHDGVAPSSARNPTLSVCRRVPELSWCS
ncbi:MAG TPA: hypothetical protein VFP78_06805 [Solirubrobacteraceae bacterium]|nr:hypothetical protein [Solirubrobacteraceae bacterium]